MSLPLLPTWQLVLAGGWLASACVGLIASSPKSGRYALGVSLSVAIPILGPVLAVIATRTAGTGQIVRDLEQDAFVFEGAADRPDEIRAEATRPPLLDRLVSEDADSRLSAHVAVADRFDSEVIELLRWTVKYGGSDSVLDAALSLEELELRLHAELQEARDEFEKVPSSANALRLAELCRQVIATDLVDHARIPAILREARAAYAAAMLKSPGRAGQIAAKFVAFELDAGDPDRALKLSDDLISKGADCAELRRLQYRVRFASRSMLLQVEPVEAPFAAANSPVARAVG